LTYDKNGSVSSDFYGSAVGQVWQNYGCSLPLTQSWNRNFIYNSRHHLKEIDLNVVPDVYCQVIPLNPAICASITGPLQEYAYDGLDRITEADCIPQGGGLVLGVQTGYGICATNPWHKHEYFYDSRGRILEELDLNPFTAINVFGPNQNPYALPCPTFDIVDHIYLGDQEVGRVLRQGNPGSACQAGDPDVDIEYIHQDSRGAIVAVESQNLGTVVAEGSVSPFGQTLYMGLPGPSGKIGGGDHVAASLAFDPGVGGAMPDGGMGVPDGGMTPDAGRTNTVSGNVLDGGPTYIGIGASNPSGGPIPTGSPASTPGATPFWATPKFALLASSAVAAVAEAATKGGLTWSVTVGQTTYEGFTLIKVGATLTGVAIAILAPRLAGPITSTFSASHSRLSIGRRSTACRRVRARRRKLWGWWDFPARLHRRVRVWLSRLRPYSALSIALQCATRLRASVRSATRRHSDPNTTVVRRPFWLRRIANRHFATGEL
jgi:hypothetical protein